MAKLLVRWILMVVSVVGASMITRALGLGFNVQTGDEQHWFKLFIGVAILAFLNATLGTLLKLLTLPLNCLTLGLFSLVINAAILLLVGHLKYGIDVNGFWAAMVASILISIINGILSSSLDDSAPKRRKRNDD